MNNKWIENVQDFLGMVMNHLILTVLAIGVVGVFKQSSPHFLIWTAMIIFPMGYYVIRARVKHFVPFLLIHLLTPALVLLAPVGWLLKGLMIVMAFFYSVVSMKTRYRENPAEGEGILPLGAVVLIGAVTLVENLYAKRGWEMYYLISAILYLGLYFINYFLNQYLFLRTVNKSSTGVIPEQAIFSSGVKQTMIFSLGSMVILFLVANIGWVAYLWSWMWRGLKALLKALILSLLNEEEVPEETEEATRPDAGGSMVPELGEETGNELLSMIWQILEKIVMIAFVVAVVVGIMWFVVKLFNYLRSRFFQIRVRKMVELEGGLDLRESCDLEKEERAASRWFGFLNNRERIRRIFRKQILKHKESIIGAHSLETLGYLTAEECCLKLTEEPVSAETLAKLYEKARYSQEEINGEEVRQAKAVTKR